MNRSVSIIVSVLDLDFFCFIFKKAFKMVCDKYDSLCSLFKKVNVSDQIRMIDDSITVLVKIWYEKERTKNDPELIHIYVRSVNAISGLLKKIQNDFSTYQMLRVHREASREIRVAVGPLSDDIVRDLSGLGYNALVVIDEE